MNYHDALARLDLRDSVCLGGCGASPEKHRRGFVFLGVAHFGDRRFTRRGLRRLLLLCARREREIGVNEWEDETRPVRGWVNDYRRYGWLYLWRDEQRANEWARELGVRFPAAWSRAERLTVLATAPAGFSRTWPALYSWASRA